MSLAQKDRRDNHGTRTSRTHAYFCKNARWKPSSFPTYSSTAKEIQSNPSFTRTALTPGAQTRQPHMPLALLLPEPTPGHRADARRFQEALDEGVSLPSASLMLERCAIAVIAVHVDVCWYGTGPYSVPLHPRTLLVRDPTPPPPRLSSSAVEASTGS
jgi:hypothetical protein